MQHADTVYCYRNTVRAVITPAVPVKSSALAVHGNQHLISTVQCSTVHYTLYNRYNKYSAEQCSAVQPLCNCTSHLWQSMVLCGLWSGVCVHNYTAWSNIIDWTGYLPLPAKHCHSQRTVRKQLAVQYKTQQTADSRSVCFSKPSRPELELFSNLNLYPNLLLVLHIY